MRPSLPSVLMPMVQIGVMRVSVYKTGMDVRMHVRLPGRIAHCMRMPMVLVMNVGMLVP